MYILVPDYLHIHILYNFEVLTSQNTIDLNLIAEVVPRRNNRYRFFNKWLDANN